MIMNDGNGLEFSSAWWPPLNVSNHGEVHFEDLDTQGHRDSF
jgi:hypothetical protein